jgi:hypothetical protein
MERLEICIAWGCSPVIAVGVRGDLDLEGVATLREQVSAAAALRPAVGVLIDLRAAHFTSCARWPAVAVTDAPVAYVVTPRNLAAGDQWSHRMALLGHMRMFFTEVAEAAAWLEWRLIRRPPSRRLASSEPALARRERRQPTAPG